MKNGSDFQEVKMDLIDSLNEINMEVEYFSLVRLPEFIVDEKITPSNSYALCIATYFDGVRLIDNLRIE